jgi:hypothetical protein
VPLTSEQLTDVQINLHAYVINLFGILDNLAWGFIVHHELEPAIGDRRNVGLFHNRTQLHLPPAVREHLQSEDLNRWFRDYLKNYRDALAHRIPLYIPPAIFSEQAERRFQEIELEIETCIVARNFDALEALTQEQKELGAVCFTFLHSVSETDGIRQLILHPQMLADGKTVIEIAKTFFRHFLDPRPPVDTHR